jgi:L-ascorbate metabolism protein UlaG (beta-lactamase superfamily)
MIITKHIHSCLLIKDHGKVILIDPGSYSVEGNAINIDNIDQLDYLLITHEHQDHLYVPFVNQLISKFPDIQILSNQSVRDILGKESIEAKIQGNEFIELINAPHEHVFGAPQFQNTLFNIFSTLTHPGDNLQFDKSCRVLSLPVQAPWGSLTQAVEHAIKIKPEYIIPIHDWHWNDEARTSLYARLKDYFAQNNIKFLGLETSKEVEI